jgi:hypothetical protein
VRLHFTVIVGRVVDLDSFHVHPEAFAWRGPLIGTVESALAG